PDRLRAYPYTGRLAMFRRTTLEAAGGIRPELALASDHDVALRVSERARRIVHVAEVLYHRRPLDPASAPERASAATLRAVAELVAAGGDKLRIISYQQQFNFARKINIGALHAQSDFLVFLNDDTEVISSDWIESLLMFASDPTVGAVGAKLRFADRRLQH